MKSKLKRKCIAILCSAATAAAVLPAAPVPVFADATKVVSIGNDLSDAEKKTMLKYFGIADDKSVQKITVTNKDEVSHLSSYIPREQIGTRTVSCAYIKPTESGGIRVRTANLQYVTANMIASTLADLGIKNCEVVTACPFQVSGTGALTGIIMAYETATGETIDKTKKDIATQEVVVTKDLAKDIGNVQAEYIINQAKAEAVQNNISDKQEIQNTVTNIVNNNNINVSNDQIENITNLTQNIVNENYGDTYINNITEINNNIKQEIAASDNVDIKVDDAELTPTTEPAEETKDAADSIMNNIDESALGDDVISSSTDDPTMIASSSDNMDTATGTCEDPVNTGEKTDDTFEITNEETNDSSTESETDSSEENTTPAESESKKETPNDEAANNTAEDDNNIPEATEDGTVGDLNAPEVTNAEQTESSEDISIPEDNISDFGYDITPIVEKYGEDAAKKFLKIEKYMKENFAFDESSQDDIDAAAALKIGDTENERKEETKEKISSISKNVLDVCYSYLTEDTHKKDITEIIKDKVTEMTANGQIDGDAVTKLYDLYKTYTASAEDVTDNSEENLTAEASDSDTEETN